MDIIRPDMDTIRRSATLRVAAVALLTLAVIAGLGARLLWAFDTERHLDAAAEVTHPPTPEAVAQTVTYPLRPPQRLTLAQDAGAKETAQETAAAPVTAPSGELSYRMNRWLTVVNLRDLPPLTGEERYLVFLRSMSGWVLAGATDPRQDGTAQVRFGADPRPERVFEVLVTHDIDDADSTPHGTPVLHWINPDVTRTGVMPWLPVLRHS